MVLVYSNDQGYLGCDGDNPQALIHFLFYSNQIDLKLIIATGSTNCAKPGTNINEAYDIINAYSKDYHILNSSAIQNGLPSYPTPEYLKSITVQGCNHSSPNNGYPLGNIEASNKIIELVNELNDDEYIAMLVLFN